MLANKRARPLHKVGVVFSTHFDLVIVRTVGQDCPGFCQGEGIHLRVSVRAETKVRGKTGGTRREKLEVLFFILMSVTTFMFAQETLPTSFCRSNY